MTPCVASVALLLALLRAALVPAEAHAHHRHHSAQAPPGSDTPDNLSITPAAAARKCGHQPLPLEERLQKAAELAPALARIRHSRDVATSWPTTRRHLHTADSPASNGVVIDVYWHIVTGTGSGKWQDGAVPASVIKAQIAVMNAALAPTPFSVRTAGIDTTINASWWNLETRSKPMFDMKRALRVGSYADLNIITTVMQDYVVGYTTLPYNTDSGPTPYDAMVINPFTMPGGNYPNYNLGITAVHELGHWLGLEHPFVEGCTEPNDLMADTPEMAGPQFACAPVDSCPDRPAAQGRQDPIHNFMGYTPDSCMRNYTADQMAYMLAAWTTWRDPPPIVYVVPASPPPPLEEDLSMPAPTAAPDAGPPDADLVSPTPAPRQLPPPPPPPQQPAAADGELHAPKAVAKKPTTAPARRPTHNATTRPMVRPAVSRKPAARRKPPPPRRRLRHPPPPRPPPPRRKPHRRPHAKPHAKPHRRPVPRPHAQHHPTVSPHQLSPVGGG